MPPLRLPVPDPEDCRHPVGCLPRAVRAGPARAVPGLPRVLQPRHRRSLPRKAGRLRTRRISPAEQPRRESKMFGFHNQNRL